MNADQQPRPAPARRAFMNPYLAGFLLGLTLLCSYLVLGAGLGASAGLARLGAALESCAWPGRAASSEYYAAWGAHPLRYYLVFMLAGVAGGGLISALLAGRVQLAIEKGRRAPAALRLVLALAGGVLVGFASRLANGCTSGQALSGGALLLSGSLLFMVFLFAGGFAAAHFFRRQWHD